MAHLDDVDALRAWADLIVEFQRANGCQGGCPLGSLASELAESDSAAREELAASYRRWHEAIRDGLAAMQDHGQLVDSADVEKLATALLSALQGGLLLAKTLREVEPLRTALHTVIDHIASFAADAERPA